MPGAWVRDSGSWKQIKQMWVRDGGAWKKIKKGWVRDSGSWKQFFTAGLDLVAGAWIISDSPSFYSAQGYADSSLGGSGGTTRGSLTPDEYDGNTILGVYTREWPLASELRLIVVMNGTLSQSVFGSIECPDIGTFTSAAASFTTSGGTSSWQWFTGGTTQIGSGEVIFS